jgi:hypothetical protein
MPVTWKHFLTISEDLWIEIAHGDRGQAYYRINQALFDEEDSVSFVVLHEQYFFEILQKIRDEQES